MSNVQEFPVNARRPSEFAALLAGGPAVLEALPGAVYICDAHGRLAAFNSEAARSWGREPKIGPAGELFCGSHRLFLPDGTPLPHDECPMADAVRTGVETRNAEVVMERPDGERITALVNIRPLRDGSGRIEGAINCFQDITAKKLLERELQERTADLEDFFENSVVGLHIVSGEGIILRANKAELAMLGYSREEYIGRHIAEFHVDAAVIGEILQRLSCGQKLDSHPARLRAKDGSIKRVLISSNSRFEKGRFVSTRCFTTDVTGLHEAECALRESESRLAATYEAATVGITETDAEGRMLRVNEALCRMLGRSRAELLGMTFLDYTHEEDRAEDAELYARQIRGEIPSYSLRKRARTAEGALLFLDIWSSSVRDEAGGFRYGVRVIQDVTAAQQLQEQLRDNEQRMRDLLEALPAAVYTTDASGRIDFFNKAAVELAGRVPQVGDEWCVTFRLFRPDGTPLPHDQCPMAVTLKENRPIRGVEAIAERPDGKRVPFVPYPTPLRDSQGKLIGAINMLVDISDRKRAERRQKILIDELNHRVKNMLMVVQSLAGQTARHAPSVGDFVTTFESRLLALARAHDLLTRTHWEHASMEAIIREVVTPVAGDAPERARLSGPDIELHPAAALSLNMALHELVTNAAKYGALSASGGTLSVTWQRHNNGAEAIRLLWRERGGPVVTRPARRGFGSRLIERCITGELGGELQWSYEPEGLSCAITFPLSRREGGELFESVVDGRGDRRADVVFADAQESELRG